MSWFKQTPFLSVLRTGAILVPFSPTGLTHCCFHCLPPCKNFLSSKTASCSIMQRVRDDPGRPAVTSTFTPRWLLSLTEEYTRNLFLCQGVIPLGGCVVSASENMDMPFAIVVNLEDSTVRSCHTSKTTLYQLSAFPMFSCRTDSARLNCVHCHFKYVQKNMNFYT